VRLTLRKVSGLVAPISSLLQQGGVSVVVKIDAHSRARIVPIKLIGQNQTAICFASGTIHPGDRLAVGRESRLMRLFAGEQLTVAGALQ